MSTKEGYLCEHCAADEGFYQCGFCKKWVNTEEGEIIDVEGFGSVCQNCIDAENVDVIECKECDNMVYAYTTSAIYDMCKECYREQFQKGELL